MHLVIKDGEILKNHPIALVADLQSDRVKFVVVPPMHGRRRDEDDMVTLQLARRYSADFVDNDNYSDWLIRPDTDEGLRAWLKENPQRHRRYTFDAGGEFVEVGREKRPLSACQPPEAKRPRGGPKEGPIMPLQK